MSDTYRQVNGKQIVCALWEECEKTVRCEGQMKKPAARQIVQKAKEESTRRPAYAQAYINTLKHFLRVYGAEECTEKAKEYIKAEIKDLQLLSIQGVQRAQKRARAADERVKAMEERHAAQLAVSAGLQRMKAASTKHREKAEAACAEAEADLRSARAVLAEAAKTLQEASSPEAVMAEDRAAKRSRKCEEIAAALEQKALASKAKAEERDSWWDYLFPGERFHAKWHAPRDQEAARLARAEAKKAAENLQQIANAREDALMENALALGDRKMAEVRVSALEAHVMAKRADEERAAERASVASQMTLASAAVLETAQEGQVVEDDVASVSTPSRRRSTASFNAGASSPFMTPPKPIRPSIRHGPYSP